MRLLIALPDRELAYRVSTGMENRLWTVELIRDGRMLAARPEGDDLWLLHECLPGLDGYSAGEALAQRAPICPPRILYLSSTQRAHPLWADCTVQSGVSADELCRLLSVLAQKPLPRLAAAHEARIARVTARFLEEISLEKSLKGHGYAQWLLCRMVPSPAWAERPLKELYVACADAHGASAASVERCLRVAVESVFTQGSMRGIERFFGATVDPERGKPTNRAFLLQAAQQLRLELRHSLAAARSPNSSEMHHSPAAPTSV